MADRKVKKVPGTYCGLPVHRLVDVLKHVPLPPNCPLAGVSSKWHCVLAPKIKEGEDENVDSLPFFDAGIPCRLPRHRSIPAHKECGDDAFDFIYNPKWNEFPKPKIAFKAGWAGPGTEMESESYHKLIKSFQEVLIHKEGASVPNEEEEGPRPPRDENDVMPEEILNLQMFHRSDPNIDPLLPILSEKLVWPDFLEEGAVCDNATRVSQRGAITWWHLDDSGEFVMQTGLPLRRRPEEQHLVVPPTDPRELQLFNEIYCLDENPASIPTKLFLYGPPNSYDWFMHDDEADVSGRIASLDVFHCPDECLPIDESLLPILTVAVLESAGRPLVSPANIPHAVISVNNCVMVEQRRICNLFIDDVAYFLQKCKHWKGNPIIYQYVSEQLQNESVLHDDVIPNLMMLFEGHDLHKPHHQLVRQRVASALFTIFTFPELFKLSDDGRGSLKQLVEGRLAEYLDMRCHFEYMSQITMRQRLLDHWEVKDKYWPRAGCVFSPPRNVGSSFLCNPIPGVCIPVVYRKSIPVYGCEKKTAEETAKEYNHMAKLVAHDEEKKWTVNTLGKYLSTVKQPQDDLMDELF